MNKRTLLRIGAISAVLGTLILVGAQAFHPTGGPDPVDHEVNFQDVADSTNWELVHLGEWFGVLLITIGLVVLYHSLSDGPGSEFGRLGYAIVLVGAAMFTVWMALDTVVVKQVDVAWVNAPPDEKAAAFRVAVVIRELELGVIGYTQMALWGVPFILYGLAVARSNLYPGWLGWVAFLTGVGAFLFGILVIFVGSGIATGELALPLQVGISFTQYIWLVVMGVLMWGKAGAAA